MLPIEPWRPEETPEEEAARREAYRRLAAAAQRVGVSLERLAQLLHTVARNEAETRAFLAAEVYGVPDEWLDELLRARLAALASAEDDDTQAPE